MERLHLYQMIQSTYTDVNTIITFEKITDPVGEKGYDKKYNVCGDGRVS